MMRLHATLAALCAALLLGAAPAFARAPAYDQREDVRDFVRGLVERHGFVEKELHYLFRRARRVPSILRAIAPPRNAPTRDWRGYRARFLNDTRVAGGRDFWSAHRAVLARAAQEFGVPEEIIVAIIGVETLYGRQTGGYRVIDALATLAFDYPPRAPFFRSELEQYLVYVRDADIDVFEIRGSYAGAIGIPQFMPSSYRNYAVDYDGDGRVDLRASAADAIGSVANYLARHGWQRDQPVWLPAQVSGDAHQAMLDAGIEPSVPLRDLRRYGVQTRAGLALDTPVALFDLRTPGAPTEYRLGLRNFYVLTRYNRSAFYASAVADLAATLRRGAAGE